MRVAGLKKKLYPAPGHPQSDEEIVVSAIHDDDGYRNVRSALANSYDINVNLPRIQVVSVDRRGTRMLSLKHDIHQRKHLDSDGTEASLLLLRELWEYPVSITSVNENAINVETWTCAVSDNVEHRVNSVNFSLLGRRTVLIVWRFFCTKNTAPSKVRYASNELLVVFGVSLEMRMVVP